MCTVIEFVHCVVACSMYEHIVLIKMKRRIIQTKAKACITLKLIYFQYKLKCSSAHAKQIVCATLTENCISVYGNNFHIVGSYILSLYNICLGEVWV